MYLGRRMILMATRKITITMPEELVDQIKAYTDAEGTSVSAWISAAAAQQARFRATDEFLADWQREHGAFTPEELAEAEAKIAAAEAAVLAEAGLR
jgi:hypothetical protein